MTGRSVPEWIGKTPDTPPPPRVIARLFEAQGGRCAECGRRIGVGGEPFDADHAIALANGGLNVEGNLRLVCRVPCHRLKSAADVAKRAEVSRKRNKHRIGQRRKSRMPGSRDSGWKRKCDGTWERREA